MREHINSKMKNLVFLLGLLFTDLLCAQNQNDSIVDRPSHSEGVGPYEYMEVDVHPKYPGGMERLSQELMKEVSRSYTGRECRKLAEIRIEVYVKVSSKGEITYVEISKSNCEKLNEVVISAFKKLEKFEPAMKNGHPVRFAYIVPFVFTQ